MDKCPTTDTASRVSGHDTDDKSKMICMDSADFTDFTEADAHGFTDYDSLTPINAYRYGVCNYQYRTLKVSTDRLSCRCPPRIKVATTSLSRARRCAAA